MKTGLGAPAAAARPHHVDPVAGETTPRSTSATQPPLPGADPAQKGSRMQGEVPVVAVLGNHAGLPAASSSSGEGEGWEG